MDAEGIWKRESGRQDTGSPRKIDPGYTAGHRSGKSQAETAKFPKKLEFFLKMSRDMSLFRPLHVL
jgi:hypothetical protein